MQTLRGSRRLVHTYLERRAAQEPDAPWLSFTRGPSYTYKQLWDATRRIAGNLQRCGVKQGDRVAIMLGNTPQFVVSWFAIHAVGAVSVPLNTAVRGSSLKHMITVAMPRIVITQGSFVERFVNAALLDEPFLEHVIVTEAQDSSFRAHGKIAPWDDIFSEDVDYAPADNLEPWDISAIIYTSGTTGAPKGIVWTHNKTVFWGEISQRYLQYGPRDHIYLCLPLFHANGLNMQLYPGLLAGSRVTVAERFSASQFWKDIVETKATITNIVGAIGPILLRQAPSPLERQHRLRRICCVPSFADYYTIFPERFGVLPYNAYGLADLGMPIWTPNDRPPQPGSCGLPAPEFECKLVNDLDEDVPANTPGELVIRLLRPWIASPGYWENAEATLKTWRNGWFHTGDLLRQDENGWFYFLDRAKDSMKRRGELVSAYEVEQAFSKNEAVVECAAYAIPSELTEDEIAIALVLRPGADVRIADLVKAAEPDLPYFALPRYVRIVPELPKTANLKVRKAELRAEGIVADAWDREAVGYTVSRN